MLTALRDYLARPVNVAVLTCIAVALPAGFGAYAVAGDTPGFLLLTTAGVIVPGTYDRRWPHESHGPRQAAAWALAASAAAVAAYALCYAAVAAFTAAELAAVVAFLVPAFGAPLVADRAA